MKRLMKSALLAATLLASSQTFAAKKSSGNGGGYNGPTLSGDAVEVSLDRPIDLDDVSKTLSKCMYDPKTRDGFLLQVIKHIPKNDIESYGSKLMSTGYLTAWWSDDITPVAGTMGIEGSLYTNSELTLARFSYLSKTESAVIEYGNRRFSFNMPMKISFDSIKIVHRYDEITQDLIGKQYYYIGLKIIRDASAPAFSTLTNMATKRETVLTAPVGDLINCIVDGLGNI